MTDDISDAEIEAVAEEIWPNIDVGPNKIWEIARAAILASRAALRTEGKKVLAREPTPEILHKLRLDVEDDCDVVNAFQAWWDAAP